MKGSNKWSRAGKIIVAFLGLGFFTQALKRLLNFNGGTIWADAGITLGAAVLGYAGLKVFKQAAWANAVLVAGIAGVGLSLLNQPVTAAGGKLGDWLRSAMGGSPGGAPAASSGASTSGYTVSGSMPGGVGYTQGQTFSGAVATGASSVLGPSQPASSPMSSPMQPAVMGGAPVQQQPQTVIIKQEAAKGPSDLAYLGGELFKSLGSAFAGTGFGLGGSGAVASEQDLLAYAVG